MGDLDKSGFTRKTTDWLGNEKEEHFDSGGNKVGETRFTTDWLGDPKQEHFNTANEKIGETRQGSDWLGNDRAEHFDSSGKRTGYSTDTTDWLQDPIQEHRDAGGQRVGESRRTEDWLGQSRKEHRGSTFKVPQASPEKAGKDGQSSGAYGGGSQAATSPSSFGTFAIVLLTAGVGLAVWPTVSEMVDPAPPVNSFGSNAANVRTSYGVVDPPPQPIWLEKPAVNWNQPQFGLPKAPKTSGENWGSGCASQNPAELSDEERAVTEAGWTLLGPEERLRDTLNVTGMTGMDGMCRPMGYQVFMFVKGQFAGTYSPSPMNARSDGALGGTHFVSESVITGTFYRYRPSDPLCCPFGTDLVTYGVETQNGKPVLVLKSIRMAKSRN